MTSSSNAKQFRILALGAQGGSVIEGLLKCLKISGYHNIVLLEYGKKAAHLYRFDERVIIKENPNDGYRYIEALLDISNKNNIKIILPGSTWDAKIIAQYTHVFKASGIIPLVNNYNTIEICDDKWKTFEFLMGKNLGAPRSFLTADDALTALGEDCQIIIKPRTGRGSKNIFLVNGEKELRLISRLFELKRIDPIIQEFIPDPDKEYTVGVISNTHGEVIQSIVMQRYLLGGATGYAKVCKPGYINEYCERVAFELGSIGPLNIQLRLNDKNEPLIFEVNPRFSGSAPMRALAGFNEPDMIIGNFVLNKDLTRVNYKTNVEYFRAFQEIEVEEGNILGKIENYL
jgi:carbamoyl-phosphate synthase large subunit